MNAYVLHTALASIWICLKIEYAYEGEITIIEWKM